MSALVRQEKYAIVNSKGDVRTIVSHSATAKRIADTLTSTNNGYGPYRAIKVVIQEIHP